MVVVMIEVGIILLAGTASGVATESVITAAIISGVISGIFLMVNQVLTFLLERYFDRREDQSPKGTTEDETPGNHRRGRDRFIPRLSRPSRVRTVRRGQRGTAEPDGDVLPDPESGLRQPEREPGPEGPVPSVCEPDEL